LTACRKSFSFLGWKRFFSSSTATASLGQKLQQAREKKELSVDQVAVKLHLSHSVIMALEEENFKNSISHSLMEPGYYRLIAVAYARFLDLDLDKIAPLLPPFAPLRSPYTTFVKKLSPLQSKPWKRYFVRQKQLTCSLKEMKSFVGNALKIIMLILVLLSLWILVRHFMRVIF
jgi:cytoskeletal protein RodZ